MTIFPRVMHCFWAGGPPSWLRLQTLTSWMRLHPTWGVTFHQLPHPPPARPLDQLSDLYRWRLLAREGGLWSDMDVLWLRPVDPLVAEWERMGADFAVTRDGGTGGRYAIGVCAAAARSVVAARLAFLAEEAARPEAHQSAGTELLLAHEEAFDLAAVANVPARLFYPAGFLRQEVARLWDEREPFPLPADLVGLHWGGGHEASKLGEARLVDAAACARSSCAVARAARGELA